MKKPAPKKGKSFWEYLGPGVITGASDDDPAGIATYAYTGAILGFNSTWLTWITLPLMSAVQEMCARIGFVTGKGLMGVAKTHYPALVVGAIALIVLGANSFNIAADLDAMATLTNRFIPLPTWALSILFAALTLYLMFAYSYEVLVKYLKWLTFALLAYIVTAFFISIDWSEALTKFILPEFTISRDNLLIVLAVLGTTISPYLFFWQADAEAEEKKIKGLIVTKHELKNIETDVIAGMTISNIIAFFIMVVSAAVLYGQVGNADSLESLANALEPLAGEYALLIFTLGIVGTGMLTIPVLAGSAAYTMAEAFGWEEGFSNPWRKAKGFYLVIIIATILGVLLTGMPIDPLQALLYSAMLYGVLSPLLILLIMHMANNPKIMGKATNSILSNVLSGITLIGMLGTAIAVLVL